MKRILSVIASLLLIACLVSFGYAAEKGLDMPRVRLETSLGNIVVELNAAAAPKTVANFLSYVNSGFYNGTVFHRVIRGFMIQGGGFTQNMRHKPATTTVQNEADNGLLNLRGTIAMARTSNPHSASSQFFINTANNGSLNFRGKTVRGWGYCVFGKVVDGMDVVDAIEKQPTTVKAPYRDVPVTPVIIKKVVVINKPEAGPAPKVKESKAPDKTKQ